jgi:uncharacterized membrane protein YfcA
MNLLHIGLILITGMIAGFLNTLGGGGSLLTMPMLIFLGLPAAEANGTNRIAIFIQNIVAVISFRSKGYFYPKIGLLLGIPAILGSIIGARVAIAISGELFEKILGVVMIIVLIIILTRPEKRFIKEIEGENWSIIRLVVAVLVFFGVGFYGGFIQAGVGFIIIVALTLITGMSLVKVNCLKVLIILIFTISSLLVFLINGKVNLLLGLTLAAGSAIGAYLGSIFAITKGDKWIRIFLIITILAMSAHLWGLFKFI